MNFLHGPRIRAGEARPPRGGRDDGLGGVQPNRPRDPRSWLGRMLWVRTECLNYTGGETISKHFRTHLTGIQYATNLSRAKQGAIPGNLLYVQSVRIDGA